MSLRLLRLRREMFFFSRMVGEMIGSDKVSLLNGRRRLTLRAYLLPGSGGLVRRNLIIVLVSTHWLVESH